MNIYKNIVTGAIINSPCDIYGKNWEKVKEKENSKPKVAKNGTKK